MARQTLAKTVPGGSNAAAGVSVTFTAEDVTNHSAFVATGSDLVMAWNSGASPYTVTVTSFADPFGRLGNITAEAIAAGEHRIYGPFATAGWKQADGNIYFDASNASVKFAVIPLT